ncbi:MAG: DNA repair protein RecO, partial [Gammaproteobacteria bacterium]|nr:DNA repair protein RecO [Gammaproteobacteria bacterium]
AMAVRHATGYALRTRPLGEADLIAEFYTLDRGRIRVVARSARRPKSRFGSALQPFTRSRLVYFQRDKDALGRLSSADIERSYFECLARLENAPLAAYWAELIMGFMPEHDPNDTMFRLIGAVLDALEADADPQVMNRYFEVWTLKLAGLFPDANHCTQCGAELSGDAWVSESSQGFLCRRECSGDVAVGRLGTPGRALLAAVLANSPAQLAAGTVSRGAC